MPLGGTETDPNAFSTQEFHLNNGIRIKMISLGYTWVLNALGSISVPPNGIKLSLFLLKADVI